MNILVCNDDGYNSYGIKLLAEKLLKYGDVTIVGPEKELSGSSHAILLRQSIDLKYECYFKTIKCYSTTGYPVDSVRLATAVLNKKFDICFSGVNNGLNLGTDIIYSSTVAIAREALIEGMYSISISCDTNFDVVDNELDGVLEFIFKNKLYSYDYSLNINFPIRNYSKTKGIMFAREGIKRFKTSFKKLAENKYLEEYSDITYDKNKDTDVFLANEGYITIVPISVDQTNNKALEKLKLLNL